MTTLHFNQITTSTPEQFVAGLTDFGPGRSELFGNSADDYLQVHDQGTSEANVTEGSGGVWERLHYDWSDPNRVVMTTTDSNVWGGASRHTYTFTRQSNGTTEVDAVVVREGKNLRGRMLGGRARARRQEPLGEGVRQDRQGHRGPERRAYAGLTSRSGLGNAAWRPPREPIPRIATPLPQAAFADGADLVEVDVLERRVVLVGHDVRSHGAHEAVEVLGRGVGEPLPVNVAEGARRPGRACA